jgi:NADH:ubiquinone oxidoreductase subunit 6 (subunit J)
VNWAGFVFGGSATIAILGAAIVALGRGAAAVIAGFAFSMVGVAGVCLAIGDDFLAILIVLLLGAALPAGLQAAARLAPPASRPPQRSRVAAAVVVGVTAFGALVTLIVRTPWPPAGGAREVAASWIVGRLMTDAVAALEMMGALLAVAAVGALALGRAASRSRGAADHVP